MQTVLARCREANMLGRSASATAVFFLVAPLATVALALADARGEAATRGTRTLSLFTISKSENKNQVQYAVQVDEHCAPIPAAPVFAYWRMLERGPGRTEALLAQEQNAYGVGTERVATSGADGGSVVIALNALPRRTILVETSSGPGATCRVLSTTVIAGQSAHLFNVYAKLKWPFSVDYLLLQGWSLDGTRVLSERLGRP